MTNKEYLKKELSDTEFAKLLIQYEEEEIWDENYEGDMERCGSIEYFVTSDNEKFDSFSEAVEHEILWLNAVRHDCSDCIFNDLNDDKVDNECCECSKGYEDHYTKKS